MEAKRNLLAKNGAPNHVVVPKQAYVFIKIIGNALKTLTIFPFDRSN
jgi:hypothetical protein